MLAKYFNLFTVSDEPVFHLDNQTVFIFSGRKETSFYVNSPFAKTHLNSLMKFIVNIYASNNRFFWNNDMENFLRRQFPNHFIWDSIEENDDEYENSFIDDSSEDEVIDEESSIEISDSEEESNEESEDEEEEEGSYEGSSELVESSLSLSTVQMPDLPPAGQGFLSRDRHPLLVYHKGDSGRRCPICVGVNGSRPYLTKKHIETTKHHLQFAQHEQVKNSDRINEVIGVIRTHLTTMESRNVCNLLLSMNTQEMNGDRWVRNISRD